MRHFLISALILSLLAGCAIPRIGPYHIDVQQGNALDQENVARLKPGLNRSQVRFLLGTPLVVDPFRTDRWDYVYLYYKAGKLTEQKHITLIFEGDTLARIEGDLPAAVAQAATPAAESARSEPQAAPAAISAPAASSLAAEPVEPAALPAPVEPVVPAASSPVPIPAPAVPALVAAPVAAPVEQAKAVESESATGASMADTSVVPPLPSPNNAPAYVDPHPVAELSLKPETNIAQIKPDAIPPFPEPHKAAPSDSSVLQSLNAWADAWSRRDDRAYFAAYDPRFVPDGGSSRSAWEARKRQALGAAKNIEVKIESPSVDRTADGAATVTFKQFYRSDNYHDVTVKQVRMVERNDRWLIVEEKVLSTLKDDQP
ncbi:outer membrane protein assembly factor BamE domain-containing protein [Thiobacillus sp.]